MEKNPIRDGIAFVGEKLGKFVFNTLYKVDEALDVFPEEPLERPLEDTQEIDAVALNAMLNEK